MTTPLTELSIRGIGPIRVARLARAGILTVEDLAAAEPSTLREVHLPAALVADALEAARAWLAERAAQATPDATPPPPPPTAPPELVIVPPPAELPPRAAHRIASVRKLARQARRRARAVPGKQRRKLRRALRALREALAADPGRWAGETGRLRRLRRELERFLDGDLDPRSARRLRRQAEDATPQGER